MENTKKTSSKASPANQPLGHGVGRRKNAVARVWLRRGKGQIIVNGKDVNDYFDTEHNRNQANLAFKVIPVSANYSAEINVVGGGVVSQAEAVKLGIARAMVEMDETMRAAYRPFRLLTVDSRVKERKKYGQRGARRKFQFVKR